MFPEDVKKKLGVGAKDSSVVHTDYDFYAVTETGGSDSIVKAIEFFNSNNGATVTKAVFPKTYTLVLQTDTLYWQLPKPKTVNVIPLQRGDAVPDSTVPGLALDQDWYKATSKNDQDLLTAKDVMGRVPNLTPKKGFDSKDHILVLHNGELYWKFPKPVVGATVKALEGSFDKGIRTDGTQFKNSGFDWLTYETVLNKPKFRKTNQEAKVGLYLARLRDMLVWVREDMPPAALAALADSFFPDLTKEMLADLSNRSWWWKKPVDLGGLKGQDAPYWQKAGEPAVGTPPQEDLIALVPESRGDFPGDKPAGKKNAGSRAVLTLHLPVYVVMPYNYYDNSVKSGALGTERRPDSLRQVPIDSDKCWSFWRTASRSSIMKISRIKDTGTPWNYPAWTDWPFQTAKSFRDSLKYDEKQLPLYVNDTYCSEVGKKTQFQLSAATDYCFSIKTGVTMVGFEEQLNAKKDVIGAEDEWIVGCMRSDYIKAVDTLAQAHGATIGDGLVIQTEIMSILERKARSDKGVDGASVRDLTVLSKDKFYVPSLSIPFIDSDMESLTSEFTHIDDPAWCNFWQKNWAEALGRAKALFLCRYGLQHANPNVQNYLIQFSNGGGKPAEPVTIVIRDVADALLHREVAWALFGDPSAAAPTDAAALGKMRLPVLKFNFRNDDQFKKNETGTTDVQFGPGGTQFLWQRFSVFYTTAKESTLAECPADKKTRVLRLLARWGIAHNAAYVRTVEKCLGTTFESLKWDQIKDPERHVTGPGNSVDDRDWEEAAAGKVHEFLSGSDGRKALCAYHNGGWKEKDPVFRIQVVDRADQPLAHQVVFLNDKAATRITDPRGEIPFYDKSFAAYTFQVARGVDLVKLERSGAGESPYVMKLPA